jgi:hypothetical protein
MRLHFKQQRLQESLLQLLPVQRHKRLSTHLLRLKIKRLMPLLLLESSQQHKL